MKQTLEALRQLQAADSEILKFVVERDELNGRTDQLQRLLERGTAELADKQEKLANVEKFYREKSGELKDSTAKAAQSKARLSGLSKQKEYLAAQKELEHLKRLNAQKEDEIVKLMEAIDEYKAGISEDEAKLAELDKQFKAEESDSEKKLKDLEKKINKIEATKQSASDSLPRNILSRYKRVLKAREGLAVVQVEAGTCSGCNMRLPPQQYNQLLRLEKLMNCPSCQRFILPSDEEVKKYNLVEVEAVAS